METETPFEALSTEVCCLETFVEETEVPGWDSCLVALSPVVTWQDITQGVLGRNETLSHFPKYRSP